MSAGSSWLVGGVSLGIFSGMGGHVKSMARSPSVLREPQNLEVGAVLQVSGGCG